ncbi:hypothetical protein MRX96_005825 [Rhipicephalus microplus]
MFSAGERGVVVKMDPRNGESLCQSNVCWCRDCKRGALCSDISDCVRCECSIIAASPGGVTTAVSLHASVRLLILKSTAPATSVYNFGSCHVDCPRNVKVACSPVGTKTLGIQRPRNSPESAVPAPPRVKEQQRSVATWTWQERQEAPKCFVSDVLWKAQRRVRRETVLDWVP